MDKIIARMIPPEHNSENLLLLIELAEKYKIPMLTIEKKLFSYLDLMPDPYKSPVYLTKSLEKNMKLRTKYAGYFKKWIKIGKKDIDLSTYMSSLPDVEDTEFAKDLNKYLFKLDDIIKQIKGTASLLSMNILTRDQKIKLLSQSSIFIKRNSQKFCKHYVGAMLEYISKNPVERIKLFKGDLQSCYLNLSKPGYLSVKKKIKLPSDIKKYSLNEIRLYASLIAVAENPSEETILILLDAKQGIIRKETLNSLLNLDDLSSSIMKKIENLHKNDVFESVRTLSLKVLQVFAPSKYKKQDIY